MAPIKEVDWMMLEVPDASLLLAIYLIQRIDLLLYKRIRIYWPLLRNNC